LTDVLQDHQTYLDRGRSGRDWVLATHSQEAFLKAFDALCQMARLKRQPCGSDQNV
jgi:hypothetical protein